MQNILNAIGKKNHAGDSTLQQIVTAVTQNLQSSGSQNQNYIWKSSSYQLQKTDQSVCVIASSDGIIMILPPIAYADDGESHFIANIDRSTKSIVVSVNNSDSTIEDSGTSITLDSGTNYEFVLYKAGNVWIVFSR